MRALTVACAVLAVLLILFVSQDRGPDHQTDIEITQEVLTEACTCGVAHEPAGCIVGQEADYIEGEVIEAARVTEAYNVHDNLNNVLHHDIAHGAGSVLKLPYHDGPLFGGLLVINSRSANMVEILAVGV
jgi:hypothetical protein